MVFRCDTVFNIRQLAGRIDYEGGTDDPHLFHAVFFLFLEHAVIVTSDLVHISQQDDLQSEFLAKGLVTEAVIGADAQHRDAGLCIRLAEICKLVVNL